MFTLAYFSFFFFFLMIRRPTRSTHCISSAASDVYKRQILEIKSNFILDLIVEKQFSTDKYIEFDDVKNSNRISKASKIYQVHQTKNDKSEIWGVGYVNKDLYNKQNILIVSHINDYVNFYELHNTLIPSNEKLNQEDKQQFQQRTITPFSKLTELTLRETIDLFQLKDYFEYSQCITMEFSKEVEQKKKKQQNLQQLLQGDILDQEEEHKIEKIYKDVNFYYIGNSNIPHLIKIDDLIFPNLRLLNENRKILINLRLKNNSIINKIRKDKLNIKKKLQFNDINFDRISFDPQQLDLKLIENKLFGIKYADCSEIWGIGRIIGNEIQIVHHKFDQFYGICIQKKQEKEKDLEMGKK
eukprot:TRINITY_DN835_c0_g1_i5.p1 TRINITY_DN835_c0_g1~~TRINITY_DN835_c0_g1_i5.p1  ORF type:complete len:356 (-),score=90.38 TRINITY_DN835_c0_g1_i5:127-1194(-)